MRSGHLLRQLLLLLLLLVSFFLEKFLRVGLLLRRFEEEVSEKEKEKMKQERSWTGSQAEGRR